MNGLQCEEVRMEIIKLWREGNFQDCIKKCDEQIEELINLNDTEMNEQIGFMYFYKGKSLKDLNQTIKAIGFFKTSWEYTKEPYQQVKLPWIMGNCYKKIGKIELAKKYYNMAKYTCEINKYEFSLGGLLVCLALLSNDIDSANKALDIYNKLDIEEFELNFIEKSEVLDNVYQTLIHTYINQDIPKIKKAWSLLHNIENPKLKLESIKELEELNQTTILVANM